MFNGIVVASTVDLILVETQTLQNYWILTLTRLRIWNYTQIAHDTILLGVIDHSLIRMSVKNFQEIVLTGDCDFLQNLFQDQDVTCNKSESELFPKSMTDILLIWDLSILIATVRKQVSDIFAFKELETILVDLTMLTSCVSSQRHPFFSPRVIHVLCHRHIDHAHSFDPDVRHLVTSFGDVLLFRLCIGLNDFFVKVIETRKSPLSRKGLAAYPPPRESKREQTVRGRFDFQMGATEVKHKSCPLVSPEVQLWKVESC